MLRKNGFLKGRTIFVGTLAPAIYIVSLFYGIGIGLLIAWILVVVKLLILYGFTANKAHQKYVINRWRTSWVSRGAAGLVLFLLFVGLYILGVNVAGIKVITYPPAIQGVLFAPSLITAGFIMIYDGFVQAVNKPITFTALFLKMPLLASKLSGNDIICNALSRIPFTPGLYQSVPKSTLSFIFRGNSLNYHMMEQGRAAKYRQIVLHNNLIYA